MFPLGTDTSLLLRDFNTSHNRFRTSALGHLIKLEIKEREQEQLKAKQEFKKQQLKLHDSLWVNNRPDWGLISRNYPPSFSSLNFSGTNTQNAITQGKFYTTIICVSLVWLCLFVCLRKKKGRNVSHHQMKQQQNGRKKVTFCLIFFLLVVWCYLSTCSQLFPCSAFFLIFFAMENDTNIISLLFRQLCLSHTNKKCNE